MGGERVIQPVEMVRLQRFLLDGWDASTAVGGRWTAASPSAYQDLATAMIIQDVYGGNILLVGMGYHEQPHYYNRLRGGQEIDLTRAQFPYGLRPSTRKRPLAREEVEAIPGAKQAYETLKARVLKDLTLLELMYRKPQPVHVLEADHALGF
jgi:hypothetical protein